MYSIPSLQSIPSPIIPIIPMVSSTNSDLRAKVIKLNYEFFSSALTKTGRYSVWSSDGQSLHLLFSPYLTDSDEVDTVLTF